MNKTKIFCSLLLQVMFYILFKILLNIKSFFYLILKMFYLRCILPEELEIDLTCSERFSSYCQETVICHRHYDNESDAPVKSLTDAKTVCSEYYGYDKKWSLKSIPIQTCTQGNSLLPTFNNTCFGNRFCFSFMQYSWIKF